MNTIFDKIYVVSLITNKIRQEFIKYQFNELNIKYEFIYGSDFYNIKNDGNNNLIKYPNVWNEKYFKNMPNANISKDFGCTLTHYNAVLQAYELGYENVLIIEDDICFIKDKKLIYTYLNNIPEDADFITWDFRFECLDYAKEHIINVKNINRNNLWYKIDNNYDIIGGLMFGLMNRETMEVYLNNQHESLNMSDHVNGIFNNATVNRYIATQCICTDHFNIKSNFDCPSMPVQETVYSKIYKLNINNFNKPLKYHCFSR